MLALWTLLQERVVEARVGAAIWCVAEPSRGHAHSEHASWAGAGMLGRLLCGVASRADGLAPSNLRGDGSGAEPGRLARGGPLHGALVADALLKRPMRPQFVRVGIYTAACGAAASYNHTAPVEPPRAAGSFILVTAEHASGVRRRRARLRPRAGLSGAVRAWRAGVASMLRFIFFTDRPQTLAQACATAGLACSARLGVQRA